METENEESTILGLQSAAVNFSTGYPTTIVWNLDRLDRTGGKDDGASPFVAIYHFPIARIIGFGARGFLEENKVQVQGVPQVWPNTCSTVMAEIPSRDTHEEALRVFD